MSLFFDFHDASSATVNNGPFVSRRTVFSYVRGLGIRRLNMKTSGNEKVSELNKIFEELLSDARDLARDLMSGITQTLVAGALSIVFGVQTVYYNRSFILQGDVVPLLLAGATIVAGGVVVLRGVLLRKKYARVSRVYRELSM